MHTFCQVEGITACVLSSSHKQTLPYYSLIPRPLPDFISQLWRKVRRRPGTITTSWIGNDGLGLVMMATFPYHIRPILACTTDWFCLEVFANSYGLHKYQVTNKQCVDIHVSGRCFACRLIERDWEISRVRASVLLHVKTSVCTWAAVVKQAQSQG